MLMSLVAFFLVSCDIACRQVLDRDLPKLHGDEVTARMTEAGARPWILMLTVSGEIQHRVEGLSIGADDDLTQAVRVETALADPEADAKERATPVSACSPPTTSSSG
jgi:DNA-binding response OmpR family regulator